MKNSQKIKLALIMVLLLLTDVLFGQTTLFVSLTGNDQSGNGSLENPFKTIDEAANIAKKSIVSQPNSPVTIYVRGGIYQNSGYTTTSTLSENSYDPENSGEAIWKQNTTTGVTVNINNIQGNPNAWITIKPYQNEKVIFEGDGDICFKIRNSSYIIIEGFEIRGVLSSIPRQLAWKYWGTYRYLKSGNYIYGDRKIDICNKYNITNSSDIPPKIFTTDFTYTNLPDISTLDVERPNIFQGKGLLVQLSHNIQIKNNEVHSFPGGGLRVTESDFVNITQNKIHHNSSRSSVGTHGLVIEGLTAQTADNSTNTKVKISENLVYSNYNEIYSWVQTKTIVSTSIDEGKGICILRTSPTESNYLGTIRVENNITYDNGKSGIHANDVENLEIIHNTVYNNAHTNLFDSALSGGTNGGISIQSCQFIKIVNNIVTVPSALKPELKPLSEGQNCSNLTVNNNIVFGSNSIDFGAGAYTNIDPLFNNVEKNDVSLKSNSPAINSGSTIYTTNSDFFGNLRKDPDLGAVEYQGSLSINSSYSKESISFYPNPLSNGKLFVDIKNGLLNSYNLKMFNIYGQVVKSHQLTNGVNKIDFQQIPGIYFIQINKTVKKLIIM